MIASYEDDIQTRVRRVIRLATSNKRSASAKIIRGAVNGCYEDLAGTLLEVTSGKALELGLTAGEQEAECATYLGLKACEAVLRRAKGVPR
jgi:hypothetical protein